MKRPFRIIVISLVRSFRKSDIEHVTLQMTPENAERRRRSDAGRQCIPGSGGRHRKSPVAECGTSRRRCQQRDGVIRPRRIRRISCLRSVFSFWGLLSLTRASLPRLHFGSAPNPYYRLAPVTRHHTFLPCDAPDDFRFQCD